MKTIGIGVALSLLCGVAAAQQASAWRDPGSGIEFVWIPKGCFQMGENETNKFVPRARPKPPLEDEAPRHEVCVDGFWLGKTEVTRAQWQRVMHGGAADVDKPQRPAGNVSREDAQQFVQRLNAQGGARFRLPTEAEWEYACRAGDASNWLPQSRNEARATLDKIAWHRYPMREDPDTSDVATLAPNAWGLHDMLGNVLEWVEDSYLENGYAQHARSNPKVAAGGERHVLRGGSFKSDWWNVRCGARMFGVSGDRLPVIGLRVVREADGQR